jgi:hypothetical protein
MVKTYEFWERCQRWSKNATELGLEPRTFRSLTPFG